LAAFHERRKHILAKMEEAALAFRRRFYVTHFYCPRCAGGHEAADTRICEEIVMLFAEQGRPSPWLHVQASASRRCHCGGCGFCGSLTFTARVVVEARDLIPPDVDENY
jgi:hypothetical protein